VHALPRVSRRYDFPDSAQFSCASCGDCCRSFDVPLAPGEAERLRGLDWSGRVERLVGLDPAVALPRASGPVRHRLPRLPDGACAFLDGGTNRCLIHERFGAAAKPLACRLYPFSFLGLGDRVAVDVAFSCSAVSAGQGAALAEHVPEWDRLLDEAGGEPAPLRPRLRSGAALPPRVVRELETHLAELLAEPGLDLVERVRCAVRYVRLALTGDPTTEAAAALRGALRAGLPKQVRTHEPERALDATQRSVFFQWLHVTVNAPRPGTDLFSGKELEAERRRRVAEADRYRAAGQRPLVGGRELSLTHEEIETVDASLLRADEGGRLARFFEAKLVGQRFLRTVDGDVPFALAVHELLLAAPVVAWTAKALAGDAGETAVRPRDVRTAIRLADRAVGQVSATILPKKLARAFEWVLTETDLVAGATARLVSPPASAG